MKIELISPNNINIDVSFEIEDIVIIRKNTRICIILKSCGEEIINADFKDIEAGVVTVGGIQNMYNKSQFTPEQIACKIVNSIDHWRGAISQSDIAG